MKNTLGSDPEIAFVKDGHIIPAGVVYDKCKDLYEFHPEIPGDPVLGTPPKGSYLVVDRKRQMRLYADGMSNEFNMGASEEVQVLVDRFRELLIASKNCADNFGCDLEILPYIPVTRDDIESGGVVCAQFGCDPDETIYDDLFDPARVDARNHLARYFGCHIHSGMTEDMIRNGGLEWVEGRIETVILAYDLMVGIPNVLLAHGEDSKLRRNVYGRAGRHRVQIPYGWEYRTPDNYIMRSPELLTLFFELSREATLLADYPEVIESLVVLCGGKDVIFNTINSCDVDSARIMVRQIISKVVDKGIINPNKVNDLEFAQVPNFIEAWEI